MKRIILLIIFVSFCINNFAQIQCPASNKLLDYWYYRDRLKYFVVPGPNRGESEIMDVRNRLDDPNPISKGIGFYDTYSTYGQEQLFFGQYIGVLATEWALLNKNQQYADANKTLNELNDALNQFDNYMDENTYWGDNTSSTNGFFIRENMPCNFMNTNYAFDRKHTELLNQNIAT